MFIRRVVLTTYFQRRSYAFHVQRSMTFQYDVLREKRLHWILFYVSRFQLARLSINSEARTQSLKAQKICQSMIVGYKLIALRRNVVSILFKIFL